MDERIAGRSPTKSAQRATPGVSPALFSAWYEAYRAPLLAWLHTISNHDARCEDWVQETFTRAWAKRDSFDGARPRAWLFKIAKHIFLDARRRGNHTYGREWELFTSLTRYEDRWRSGELRVPADAMAPAADAELEQAETRAELQAQVQAILAELTPAQRSALWACRACGQTVREYAAATGHSATGTKLTAYRGRLQFRARYEARYGKPESA